MGKKLNVALYLGSKFMARDEEPRKVFGKKAPKWYPSRKSMKVGRQVLVVAMFVVFIFTLTALNVSFDLTFHRTQDALATHGSVLLSSNGTLVFNAPPNAWYWNSTSAFVDNATLQIIEHIKQPFDTSTWAIALMLFVKEATATYSDARADNEENRKAYGRLYVIGVRPEAIWPAFFLQRLVVYSFGTALGAVLSIYVVLPYMLTYFQGTIGALFFQSFDYGVSFVTACLMVSVSMTIRAAVLWRGTTHAKLGRILSEIS